MRGISEKRKRKRERESIIIVHFGLKFIHIRLIGLIKYLYQRFFFKKKILLNTLDLCGQ